MGSYSGSAVAAAAPGAAAAPSEEKSEFTVFLSAAGDKKINVIKEVRSFTGLGLKKLKIQQKLPKKLNPVLLKRMLKSQKKLEAAGAKVELK